MVLKPPRVHPLVRQGVAASMAEHVDVDRKPDPSFGASPFNHPGNAHSPKGCTTFVDEDISRLIRQSPEPPQLVALQVVSAIPRSLQPSDDDRPRGEIDIIPSEIAGLANPKAIGDRSSGR